jgi:acid stress-induced BolA-like protein IbaG/YrbA
MSTPVAPSALARTPCVDSTLIRREQEMKVIHAITMKCKTSQQWEKMQAK